MTLELLMISTADYPLLALTLSIEIELFSTEATAGSEVADDITYLVVVN